jgi:pimeloyl-ACP methyl ester carboxylesterase
VFERLGGTNARAAATAFWTSPDEEAFARYEELCIPLYTRRQSADLFERAVRNPAMRLVFVEEELRRLDLMPRLNQIRCPTLIVAGEDDPITPVEDIEEMAAAMRPEVVRLERFANAGHGVYRDCPLEFFEKLRDFMGA